LPARPGAAAVVVAFALAACGSPANDDHARLAFGGHHEARLMVGKDPTR
jgi:hypothetical protein